MPQPIEITVARIEEKVQRLEKDADCLYDQIEDLRNDVQRMYIDRAAFCSEKRECLLKDISDLNQKFASMEKTAKHIERDIMNQQRKTDKTNVTVNPSINVSNNSSPSVHIGGSGTKSKKESDDCGATEIMKAVPEKYRKWLVVTIFIASGLGAFLAVGYIILSRFGGN